MATYYIKSTGNDSLDGLSDANAWLSITKLNATTFAAGDIIKLRCGDSWTGMWTVLGSGTSGSPITITNYGTGALPIINANSANAQAIRINGNSYITVDGVYAKNATGVNIYGLGTVNGFTVKNCTTSGPGSYGIYANLGSSVLIESNTVYQGTAEGIFVSSASSATPIVRNNNLIGVSGRTSAAISINGSSATFTGNTITGWATPSTGTKLIRIQCSGVTVGNNTVTNSGGYNFYFDGATGVVLTGENTSTGSLGNGFYFTGASAVSGNGYISVSNCLTNAVTFATMTGSNVFAKITVDNAAAAIYSTASLWTIGKLYAKNITANNGVTAFTNSTGTIYGGYVTDVTGATGYDAINVSDGTTVSIYNMELARATKDGLSSNLTGVVYAYYVWSHHNGSTVSTSGDGFTNHQTSSMYLDHCIGSDNWKSGIQSANIGGGGGVVYNCTFYNNYNSGNPLSQWYGMGFDGGTWTVKNNITQGNVVEMHIGSGATVTSNYNCFYDSRGGSAFEYNGTAYSFSDYKNFSSQDANSINVDPKFVDEDNGKLYLRYDSPCIDTGTNLGATYRNGIDSISTWPNTILITGEEPLWDMGAFVFRESVITDDPSGLQTSTIWTTIQPDS